jgi:hypothetical protein
LLSTNEKYGYAKTQRNIHSSPSFIALLLLLLFNILPLLKETCSSIDKKHIVSTATRPYRFAELNILGTFRCIFGLI